MSRIRVLSESVANKIAAGEVVERPASVVKELVENSIDAGARKITVDTEGGGKRLIRVADDGCGMTPDDALLAFERHATSKMKTADDLLAIATLGFRGEALPSIASVARVWLETRSADAPVGSQVEMAGGKMMSVKEIGASPGTTLVVRDLFFNIPARRKFLKSESTELGHISSLVTHYALAHPDVYFLLRSTTNEILNVPPVATFKERIYQVFGQDLLSQLIEIEGSSAELFDADESDEPESQARTESSSARRIRIHGFVSLPEVHRLNRNAIYVFVNRRLVRDRLLLHALSEAYQNLMPSSVYPAALVFIDIPFSEVDVNVHPSKVEVRFRRSGLVHDLMRDTIRAALLKSRPIATFRPKERQGSEEIGAEVAASEHLGNESFMPDLTSRPQFAPSRAGFEFKLQPVAPEPQSLRMKFPSALSISPYVPSESGDAGIPGTDPGSIMTEPLPEIDVATLADHQMAPLGQIHDSFIVASDDRDLYLLDQHAAHERVLFEKHVKLRTSGQPLAQRLLMPLIVELDPRQITIFDGILPELTRNGFEVEPFGKKTVAIKAAPAGIDSSEVEVLLREIIESLEKETQAVNLEKLQTKIAASIACHAAIKVNMKLDLKKMQWLIDALLQTQFPMSCPHGRPVILRYGLREIERAFKRP
ncbi:MAG: DNA mismatch repair endonuclease MutL [Acidobacteriia bacterium]|nr:DNA mismatch repair endonuclease MutL [Terriglobia bacterium]